MSTVHVGFAYRFTSDCHVIGHFAEYYLEGNFVIGREDRRARVGSVLHETQ